MKTIWFCPFAASPRHCHLHPHRKTGLFELLNLKRPTFQHRSADVCSSAIEMLHIECQNCQKIEIGNVLNSADELRAEHWLWTELLDAHKTPVFASLSNSFHSIKSNRHPNQYSFCNFQCFGADPFVSHDCVIRPVNTTETTPKTYTEPYSSY